VIAAHTASHGKTMDGRGLEMIAKFGATGKMVVITVYML